MPSLTALVEPSLLSWARQRANVERIAADRKIGVPEGRVEEWEDGTTKPTIAQLRNAAEVYKRPLGVFFLPKPPEDFETLRDFRRIQGSQAAEWSVTLHDEYRRAHAQRDALLELADLDDAQPSEAWRLDGLPDDDERIAAGARQALMAASPLPVPTRGADKYRHLNYWIAALEQMGVLVMHTQGGEVSKTEMRAFSLYFDEIPVIVLNGADWPRGRLFSLIHEYAHLLLHTSGLCDTTTDRRAVTGNRRLEARCNAIAASVLMPAQAVRDTALVKAKPRGHVWTLDELIEAARPFGVSVESFLRRLTTLDRVPLSQYQAFRAARSEGEEPGRKADGGNANITKVRNLGRQYVRTVVRAQQRGLINSATAATFLDVKVARIPKLAEKAGL